MTRKEDPGLWDHAQRLWWQQPRKRGALLMLLFVLVVVPLVYSQNGGIKDEVQRQGNVTTYLLALITLMTAIIGWFLKGLVTDIRLVKEEYIRMNVLQQQQAKDIDDLEGKRKPRP